MRATTVKALSVGGKRKVFYSGETVKESDFYAGDFDKRIADGHLSAETKEVKSRETIEHSHEPEQTESEVERPIVAGQVKGPELGSIEGTDLTPPGDQDPPALTVAEIKKDLDAKGIKYPATAKKEELLKLLAGTDNL